MANGKKRFDEIMEDFKKHELRNANGTVVDDIDEAERLAESESGYSIPEGERRGEKSEARVILERMKILGKDEYE